MKPLLALLILSVHHASAIEKLTAPADDLTTGFTTPPHAARPWVYWCWSAGQVSAEGIRKDLEWMARVGVGGANLLGHSTQRRELANSPLFVDFMTPEWRRLIAGAVREADRVGVELDIIAGDGWSGTRGRGFRRRSP